MSEPIRSIGINSIESGPAVSITIHSHVSNRIPDLTDNSTSLYLDDSGVIAILAAIAVMPAYRDVFRVLANELDCSIGKDYMQDPNYVNRIEQMLARTVSATIESL